MILGIKSVASRLAKDQWPEYLSLSSGGHTRRFELDEESLRAWLNEAWSSADAKPDMSDKSVQCKTALTWVQQQMLLHEEGTRVRVRAYTDKGLRKLWTVTLETSQEDGASGEGGGESGVKRAASEEGQGEGAERAQDELEPNLGIIGSPLGKQYRALGEQYTHVTRIAFATADRSSDLYERHVKRLEAQLLREQDRRAELENLLLERTREEAERNQANQEKMVELARIQVAQQTIAQVGTTAQVYLTGQKMPKLGELVPLLDALSADEELLATLKSPQTVALLKNAEVRAGLKQQLKAMGSMGQLEGGT